MKTKRIVALCVALLPIAFVCSASAAETNASVELNLRGLDALWSKTAKDKDLDKTVSFYAEDAMVCPPNAAIATTKEAVRKIWKDLLDSPGVVVTWKTAKVDVAQSGDLGYTSGTYEIKMNDASGKPVNDHGKYLEVWKKQTDGSWKCVADIWNSDLPAAAEKK